MNTDVPSPAQQQHRQHRGGRILRSERAAPTQTGICRIEAARNKAMRHAPIAAHRCALCVLVRPAATLFQDRNPITSIAGAQFPEELSDLYLVRR